MVRAKEEPMLYKFGFTIIGIAILVGFHAYPALDILGAALIGMAVGWTLK